MQGDGKIKDGFLLLVFLKGTARGKSLNSNKEGSSPEFGNAKKAKENEAEMDPRPGPARPHPSRSSAPGASFLDWICNSWLWLGPAPGIIGFVGSKPSNGSLLSVNFSPSNK